MKEHKWNIADSITVVRMGASLMLWMISPRTLLFFIIYSISGITDVLDGWVARKYGLASSFGAKLDSVADLLFYGTMLIRFFPILYMELPRVIWYVVAGILLIRLVSYAITALKNHCMASLHTKWNKLTGAGVFLLPYVLETPVIVAYGWMICGLAIVSSAEELLIHILQKISVEEK